MFKPLEMVKVSLQVLHSDSAKVTHVIAKQGLFHLLDSRKFSKTSGKSDGEEFKETIVSYSTLEQDLKNLFKSLSIGRVIKKDIEVEPLKELKVIEDAVKRIQKNLHSQTEKIARFQKQQEEKEHQLALLRSIESAGPDLDTVRKFTYFYKAVGFIAAKETHRLEASLSSINFTLIPLANVERRSLIVVLCLQKDKDVVNRALKSVYFEAVNIPDLSQGSIGDAIAKLEIDIQKLIEQKTQVSQELRETQKEVVQELQTLREKVALALLILNAQRHYGKGARSYIIQGWVPRERIQELEDEVIRVTEGRARFETSEPELVEEVKTGAIKIPILFNNPYLIRPFESVVFNYGTQEYNEIDPTPIVAISFLLMFGLMFGDIGHGAVLFGIGYWVFKRFYQFMDYGIIVMECGASSAFFGLLYGSIFGVEHWIPALWLHPAEQIKRFMTFAIGLGVVMISAAVILNVVNSFRKKDFETGLLGHYGIVGGLFYWTTVGLGIKYAVYGHLGLSTKALILLLAIPLGVMFFREPLGHVLFKKHDEKMFPAGVGMFVMEAVIDVIDIVVRYLASTVSFVRTAAFALAHGGLFIAVFSLADIVGSLQGGGLWYWLVIFLGNVLIIALEGMVVSIQTIRLEYYEFFSKFFQGGGERFHPLKIE
ncbi:hypothetical protein CSA56_11970 [candidate division KSB3 bacterium]|uniref:Uncharacterized protein n=1 Tax=candidate division KSB3 bacterium TaxID=2044937 RepID=A0A2G6KDC9_9BACT|nr:MAG: hypothetical protein CSA56_11970 [candidate division KSB3 bacterium]